MIKPLGKATLLLAHARTYPIPKDLQTYKGVQEETLSKNCQQSQDMMSPRILPRKIQKRLLGDQGPQRDPKVQEIHAAQ